MKKIYQFECDFGRMGSLEGCFLAESDLVDKIIGKEIHFGEVLGKHSDVSITLNEKHLNILSDDYEFIDKFQTIMGINWSVGHNPILEYTESIECDDPEEYVKLMDGICE